MWYNKIKNTRLKGIIKRFYSKAGIFYNISDFKIYIRSCKGGNVIHPKDIESAWELYQNDKFNTITINYGAPYYSHGTDYTTAYTTTYTTYTTTTLTDSNYFYYTTA